MSWSPKVDYFFTTSNKFLSVQPVTFTNSVDDFKTSAEFTDYLMSVALIKTATIIWICWITIKNPTKYNMKDLSFNFF